MVHDVLIVEADAAESRHLQEIVSRLELSFTAVGGGMAAIEEISEGGSPPAIVLVDLQPNMNGLALVRKLRENLSVPIIALTEPGADRQALLAAGASDLLIKPAAPDRIEASLRSSLKISALQSEIGRMRRKRDGHPEFCDIIAGTPEMQRALTLGKRAADHDLPVLIEGEPGTGKELMAQAIYNGSERSHGPFHVVHCAHLRDAAEQDSPEDAERMWQEAEGGVLYLEEISDLPLPIQEKLSALLATETGFARDGKPRVRVICTSSRNLIERVKKELFREDLYYRINVFPIWLPPLRDRTGDIEELARHFLTQVIAEEGKRIELIDPAALTLLQSYVWPGNVAQLEKTIFRGVVLADGDCLTVDEFPQIAAQVPGFAADMPAAPRPVTRPLFTGPAMIGGTWPVTRSIAVAATPNGPSLGIPALTEDGEIRRLEDMEADMIRLALGHYRGHITEVARRLGIGRSTLYRKMREFGLEVRHN